MKLHSKLIWNTLQMKAVRQSDGLSCWSPSPENRNWKLEFDQFQWSDLCEWSCITSWIVLRLDDLIFYTDSLYRLLSRLSYNWRRALLYVPILVLLLSPLSPYLFLLLYAFDFEVIVFIVICSICICSKQTVFLSWCNVNIAFILQMWRAESQKARVGSCSKAAEPCLHPRLSATMPCVRGECELHEWGGIGRGLGGVGSCLHGNLKHGVTDVIHPAVHLLLLLLPPHAPVCHPTFPMVPNACLESGRTLVCMSRSRVDQCCSALCPLSIFMTLISKVHELVFCATLMRKGAVELMHVHRLFGAAAWFWCNTKFPPHCCSTDDACRSWLVASVSHFLHTQFDCFWLLTLYFLVF